MANGIAANPVNIAIQKGEQNDYQF